jgi:predicted AAA+ superfamily ATPase
MYIKRNIEEAVIQASKEYPVVMVCGQRQVGKSTMLNHIKENNRRYVSFDDRQAKRLAETDPTLFFETYGYPILIDEFQKVPTILETIKDISDKLGYEGKDNNGLFWLTGSQKFEMMKGVSESLAGRVAVFEMSSLSKNELFGKDYGVFNPEISALKKNENIKSSVNDIYGLIFKGGMPKINASSINRDKYYSDYINTYLERDIKELSQVGKLDEFYVFLVYIAARTGQEIKYDEISKQVGISAPTAKSWITILERSGVIFILRPYSSSVTNRLVKTPKMYFMDTGLAAYLCRWPNAETLQNGNMDGAFLETYVVSEIVKSYYNSGTPVNNLYYYRDIDQKEIDLLIVTADSIYPIEVKKSKDPSKPDKNFNVLNKFGLNVKPGLVICMCDEIVPINKNCYLIPVSLI